MGKKFRKTENWETKTEIALLYEMSFREMFIFFPISTASEIKVMIGWINRSKRNYLFMATSAGSEMCLCTLVQALRLCTGRTAHKGSRGIALVFHDHGTRRGWGVSVTPRPLFTSGKDPAPIVQEAGRAPDPVWTGGEKSRPHRDSIPGPPSEMCL